MSEYKGIKGFQVQTRTEDPTPYAQALADNPYAGAWGSGGSLNTARTGLAPAQAGTQTASLAFGGNPNVDTTDWDYDDYTEFAEVEYCIYTQLSFHLLPTKEQQ